MSFKFQPILNLRKHHEDHCRTCLKEEQTKLRQIDGELSMLKASKEKREKEKEQMSLSVITRKPLRQWCLAYLRQKQAETKVRRTFQAVREAALP